MLSFLPALLMLLVHGPMAMDAGHPVAEALKHRQIVSLGSGANMTHEIALLVAWMEESIDEPANVELEPIDPESRPVILPITAKLTSSAIRHIHSRDGPNA